MADWEERGNVDKRREDIENTNSFRSPSDREGYSTRTDFRREDGYQRMGRVGGARRAEQTNNIFKVALATMGTIAAF